MISLKKIVKAQTAIAPYIQTTSLVRVDYLSELTQMNVFLKLENMQYTGSFKLRGAMNKIAQLSPEEKARGVVAASAGNHAQGVARSAKIFGVKATIVMPTITPIIKVKATKDYGAEVILYGDNYDEACNKALKICRERGAVFVHPFNDEAVICGQGTIGLEIMTQLRNIDAVVVPVGGGGLIAGVAKAAKSLNPNVKVIGVEAANAPCVKESMEAGRVLTVCCTPTIAEGIAVACPGELTFKLIQEYVDDIVAVDEDEIASALLSLLEKQKIVVEGSGATPVAALLNHKLDYLQGKNVVCVISGGNIDINMVETIINSGLMKDGRRFNLQVKLKHKAGELQKLLSLISKVGGNILSIEQTRYANQLELTEQFVHLVIEAYDIDHKERILSELRSNNYAV
ncbi:MAG: threonine ammonia-lyase [Bacilli bacterium]|jgi:threonine dehydratase|nr:threonine ammonia-lyase [Bacilli bacterium]HHU24105.1 threonine ammonia-lyase [Acholeplasmataceae bacterium]